MTYSSQGGWPEPEAELKVLFSVRMLSYVWFYLTGPTAPIDPENRWKNRLISALLGYNETFLGSFSSWYLCIVGKARDTKAYFHPHRIDESMLLTLTLAQNVQNETMLASLRMVFKEV